MSTQHMLRWRRALKRLTAETRNLLNIQACLEAIAREQVSTNNMVLQLMAPALDCDRLLRLVRILEDSNQVASFWYLRRCEPKRFDNSPSMSRLADISERLKSIRDKSFIHIDKEAVFDPEAIYRAANLLGQDLAFAVDFLWATLTRLHKAEFNQDFPGAIITRVNLVKDYRRELRSLTRTFE